MAPALRRDFLLPFDDICNIGEPVEFSIYLYWIASYRNRKERNT
jgi:hypothetical protein